MLCWCTLLFQSRTKLAKLTKRQDFFRRHFCASLIQDRKEVIFWFPQFYIYYLIALSDLILRETALSQISPACLTPCYLFSVFAHLYVVSCVFFTVFGHSEWVLCRRHPMRNRSSLPSLQPERRTRSLETFVKSSKWLQFYFPLLSLLPSKIDLFHSNASSCSSNLSLKLPRFGMFKIRVSSLCRTPCRAHADLPSR